MDGFTRRGAFALGAGMVAAGAAPFARERGFTHDVASGEPGARSVLLWTRHVSADGARLRAEVAEDAGFARVVAGGEADASPARDFTARVGVAGLTPDRWYHYRFVAPDGTISPVGRTRTLPEGDCARFTLGVFSCSNMPFGYFNAYAHAAARPDIDLTVHLGDYFYEYDRAHYPTAAEAVAGRWPDPVGAAVHLADYRARFASYRRDPDLARLHNRFPMIAMWDDHESANDSWTGGAENHRPATEGDWTLRKRAAVQAYREWMPVSDADWAEYRIGTLATLFRPEERLDARTHQVDLVGAWRAGGEGALAAFRRDVWEDPAHTLFPRAEQDWFDAAMARAARSTRWQVLAQQVNVGFTHMPEAASDWVPAGDKAAGAYIAAGIAAARAGMPFNMDSWNGYPAARSRMLRSGLDRDADLVVLSGDSHNAWAFDLSEDGHPAGVEFGGQSVTSPGYEAELRGVDPRAVAAGLVAASPELRWAETSRRGYMTVALTRERASAEWLFLDTVRRRSTTIAARHREAVAHGSRKLTA